VPREMTIHFGDDIAIFLIHARLAIVRKSRRAKGIK
jgi:hypothetical protein